MPRRPALLGLLLLVASRLCGGEIDPVAPGPYPVAATNLEATSHDSGAMFDYLNGKKTAAGTRYLTDILVHPDAVPTVWVEVPADAAWYGAQAGQRIPLVLLVVYPTTKDNPRPAYTYPYAETGDRSFPHMERPGDRPLLADPAAKYPLIVMSGGYNTHGLWHLGHLKELAAHGYIVADVFHGDGRETSFAANLALRSLALRATIDYLLRHPDFARAIDADRIGVNGESAGGHTIAAALGGIDPDARVPAGTDSRVKAAFGLVPFLGGTFGFWPFRMDAWYFGADHAGLRSVQRPFLAVYGGKDHNVPPEGVIAAVRAMQGPRFAVELDEETHTLTEAAHRDVRTWEVVFFDAWLRGNTASREALETATAVRGGASDRKTFQSSAPQR